MLQLLENISLKIGFKKHVLYFGIFFASMLLNLPYDLLGKERSTEFILTYIKPFPIIWLILGLCSLFIFVVTRNIYSLKTYFHITILNCFLTIFFFSNFFISFYTKEYLLNSFIDTIYVFLPLSIFSFLYYLSFSEYVHILSQKIRNKK